MISQALMMLFLSLFLVIATALPAPVEPVFTFSLITEPIVRYPTPTLVLRRHKATTSSSSAQTTTTSIMTSLTTPSSTLPVTTTSTSSSSSYIASKTSVPDCNYQGLPSTLIIDYIITTLFALTPLACQTACENITDYITTINGTVTSGSCLSYSFRAPAESGFANCELFSVPFTGQVDGIDLVIKDLVSGMYYSNRWPEDGSGFCYS